MRSGSKDVRLVELITLLAMMLLAPILPLGIGSAITTHSITIGQNQITLQTQTVSLILSIPQKGSIVNLTNLLTNQFLVLNQSASNFLWAVDAFNLFLTSTSASQFSYSTSETSDSSNLLMTWQVGSLLSVRALLEARQDGFIAMNLNVTNLSPTLMIKRVFFPYLGGIQSIGRSSADDFLAIPEREGYVIQNATSSIVSHPMGFEYPGTLSMQFVYFYEKDRGGIYVGVHDSQSNYKGIEVFKDSSNAYRFDWYHYAANITSGSSFVMNYFVMLRGVVGPDWWSGAEIYREWATQQWYVSRGPLDQRTDIPAWVKDLDLVWAGNSYVTNQTNGQVFVQGEVASQIPSYAGEVKTMFPNASLMLYWMGWNRDGFDRGYPEYYLPRDGVQTFQQAITSTHGLGLKVLLYFNGRLVDTATQTYNKSKPYLTVDQNGAFYAETYNGGYLKAVVPDPSTAWWKNTVINFSTIAVRDYGADGVYLDQISVAGPKLDFSANHGHAPGGGSWWWKAESDLLEGLRSAIRAYNPQAIISSENVNEVYIRDIDIFQSYDYQYDFTNAYPTGYSAPLFSYVYHEYTLQFLTFLPPLGVPSVGEGAYLHGITESLTRGYVPGVFTASRPSQVWWFTQVSSSVLQTVVETRQAFKQFLDYCTMLQPPTFQTQLSQFSGGSTFPRSIAAAAIAAGVFQSADGRVIVVLANRAPDSLPQSGTFTDGLPPTNQTSWLTEALNNQTTKILLAKAGALTITVPSLSVETFTVESAPITKMIAWQGRNYQIPISSSSQIESIALNSSSKAIMIGINESRNEGYFHIAIPSSLLAGNFVATVDMKSVAASTFQNSSMTSLTISYGHGIHHLAVAGSVLEGTTTTTTTTSTTIATSSTSTGASSSASLTSTITASTTATSTPITTTSSTLAYTTSASETRSASTQTPTTLSSVTQGTISASSSAGTYVLVGAALVVIAVLSYGLARRRR